ncbi:MAG: carbon-nitrogen hydrolase family protein [Solirubrobacteraceae bacterium]|nr:carbon-nitrogen hydrolase family protein [Solirubrobacteraceae bacterium]
MRDNVAAVAQIAAVPADVKANVAQHAELIGEAAQAGAGIVVFPELSLTGYELAAVATDPTLTLRDVDLGGQRLALAVCFDSAHPQHAGQAAQSGADVYIVGAMFVEGEEAMVAERMSARAVETGMWIGLAQHAGPTGSGRACGGSGFWSPAGAVVTQLGTEAPALAVAEVGHDAYTRR